MAQRHDEAEPRGGGETLDALSEVRYTDEKTCLAPIRAPAVRLGTRLTTIPSLTSRASSHRIHQLDHASKSTQTQPQKVLLAGPSHSTQHTTHIKSNSHHPYLFYYSTHGHAASRGARLLIIPPLLPFFLCTSIHRYTRRPSFKRSHPTQSLLGLQSARPARRSPSRSRPRRCRWPTARPPRAA